MNYEKLTKLATLLDQQHGKPGEISFIVCPHSEALLEEHKKALMHTNRVFHYEPESNERLGIASISKAGADYTHSRLEHMSYDSLSTPEIAPLMDEYIEFARSRPE